MAFPCANEDGNEAAMGFTIVETGEVMWLCGGCVPEYVKVLAEVTGTPPPEGHLITVGQLIKFATGRELAIEGIKESNPAKAARLAELETVISAIQAISQGDTLPDGVVVAGPDDDDDDDEPDGGHLTEGAITAPDLHLVTAGAIDYGDQGIPPY